MRYSVLITAVLFAAVLISPVLAAPNPNFTPIFDQIDDQVHYNITSTQDNDNTTPIEIWAGLIVGGLLMFLYTLQTRTSVDDLIRDAIISVMAWFPIGYGAWTSFAVSRVTSFGVAGLNEDLTNQGDIVYHEWVLMEHHTIYHFPVIGFVYGIFFLVAIVNTFRIIMLHRALQLRIQQSPAQKQEQV